MTNDEMGAWAWALILLSAGITLACLLLGRRLHKLGLTLLILVSVWAAVWLVGDRLQDSDWNNLTGWVDCRTSCDVWDSVGLWFLFGPPVVVVVAVVAATVVAAIDRFRARHRT